MSLAHPFTPLIIDNEVGQLLFTPCPGTKEVTLRQSLVQLANAGAVAILTLMPTDEMQRNEVTHLPDDCASLGLQWFHLPIEDDHAPEQAFENAWRESKDKILALLNEGKTIAIHCKGGSGRTGLMAALILLERGLTLDDAIARVRSVRPNALQIPAHQEYITNIAQQISR